MNHVIRHLVDFFEQHHYYVPTVFDAADRDAHRPELRHGRAMHAPARPHILSDRAAQRVYGKGRVR